MTLYRARGSLALAAQRHGLSACRLLVGRHRWGRPPRWLCGPPPGCTPPQEQPSLHAVCALQGVSGFLPKKEAAAAGRALAPGALLEAAVAPGGVKPAGGGSTSVTVQCSHEAVSGAVAREWEGLNIGEGARADGRRESRRARECFCITVGHTDSPNDAQHAPAGKPAPKAMRGFQHQPPCLPPPALPSRLAAAWPAGDGAGAQRSVRWPALLLPHLLQASRSCRPGCACSMRGMRGAPSALAEHKGRVLGQPWGPRHLALGALADLCHAAHAARLLCSGTVDPFHLGTDLAADWRKQFR